MKRRSLLALAAAGAALPSAGGAAAAAAAAPDFTSGPGRMRAYMQMRGALDDRLVIGCQEGRYYGVVGDDMRPLYGVISATFSRYRSRADGGYDAAGYETSFFTDLQTGKVLERFANPYTGQTVEVPLTNYPPAAFVITPDLELVYPKPPPGLVSRTRVLPTQVIGDDVWMTEEITSALTLPSQPKPVRYSELTTMHARRADLAAPGVQRARTDVDFISVVSWRPWLKMGDQPGHLMGTGHGRGVSKVEELPADLLAACARYKPQVLSAPGAPLAGLLS